METFTDIVGRLGPTAAARDLGCSHAALSMILSGKRQPSLKMLARAREVWGSLYDFAGSVEAKVAATTEAQQ
jgi:transcriptional regulator with XRE-family HTH domain